MKIEHKTRNTKPETRNPQPATRIIFILLFSALLMLSCAAPEPVHPPEISEIEWQTRTPIQVLDRLRHEQAQITELTAAFSLSVDPPPEGQPSHMRGVLFFAKKPNGTCVRIKGLGPFGRLLFDLVQQGESLQIYIPSRKTLYQGQTDPTGRQENIWAETLQTAFTELTEACVLEGAVLTFKDDMVIVPLKDGKLMLDRSNGILRVRHSQNKIIVYDRYDQKQGHPPIPTHIEVKTTDDALHAVCQLSQVNLNSNLSDAFDLSAYNARFVRDLKDLDMKTRDQSLK